MLYIGKQAKTAIASAAIGATLGALVTKFVFDGPIPFVDRGGQILATDNPQAMQAIIEVLELCGFKVAGHRNTASVDRTFMKKGNQKIIVNYTREETLNKMDRPSGGCSVVVANPSEMAKLIAARLKAHGYSNDALGRFDKDAPEGMLDGVRLPTIAGELLVTRAHALKMGRPDKPAK